MALSAEEQANEVRANSARLLDELNTIENRSAANMGQITHVMNQFASSGQLAGDSISYMAAASATLIEAGEEQGKAGRAMKMMYARLGANTGNMAQVLEGVGVATRGANGELRSMEDVIGDLAAVYPSLTEEQQLQAAQALAGNDHYVRAIKLIQGHTRTTNLNTMAIDRMDSAVDEANKKLQDQAYLLKQSEAGLYNAKAAVGDALVPQMIKFNNESARMNNAMADILNSNNAMVDAFVDGGYFLQRYMRLYAPLGEAILNMMSLNVALRTQQAIMRGLAQQDVVRASAYGGRSQMQAYNLTQMHKELALVDMIQKIDNRGIEMKRAEIQLQDIKSGKQFAFNQKQMEGIRTELAALQLKNAAEVSAAENIRMIQAAGATNTRKAINSRVEAINLLQSEVAVLKGRNVEEEVTQQKLAQQMATGKLLTQDKRNSLTISQQQNYLLEDGRFKRAVAGEVAKQQLITETAIAQKEAEINQQLKFRLPIHHLIKGMGDQEIQQQNARMKVLQGIVGQELGHVLAKKASGQATGMQTQAEAALAVITVQGNSILGTKLSLSQKQTQLADLAANVSLELAAAYGVEATELMSIITKLPMYNALMEKATKQAQMQFMAQQRVNSVMMGTSMILGVASMLFSMIGDDAESARIAMILMMLSMVPMTVQMFKTAGGAFTAAGGIGAMTGAMTAAEIAAYKLRTAIMTTGIGALVVGLGIAISYFGDWGGETETATVAMEDFAESISYTNEQLQEMNNYFDEVGMGGILEHRVNLTKQIGDLEAELRQAEADGQEETIKYLKDKIRLKKEELMVSGDIVQTEGALSVTNMTEADSRAIYENLSSSSMAAAAEASAGLDFFKDSSFVGGGEDGFMTRNFELLGAEYNNLSEDMRGFVYQAAQAATSYEDFMLRIAEFADDYPEMNDFSNSFSNSVIGPIEAAKEAAFEFANAREEMFFGMAKGNITGDMVKQVVNKGVETLINTVEVVQTNNFNGMTTKQAADAIVTQIENGLKEKGINLEYA